MKMDRLGSTATRPVAAPSLKTMWCIKDHYHGTWTNDIFKLLILAGNPSMTKNYVFKMLMLATRWSEATAVVRCSTTVDSRMNPRTTLFTGIPFEPSILWHIINCSNLIHEQWYHCHESKNNIVHRQPLTNFPYWNNKLKVSNMNNNERHHHQEWSKFFRSHLGRLRNPFTSIAAIQVKAPNWVSNPEIRRDPSLIKLCSHPATTTTFMCLTLWRGWKCSSLFIDTLPMKLVRPSSLYSISFTDSCTKTCFLICLKINLLCSTDRVLQQLVLEPGGWSRGVWDFPRTKAGWVDCVIVLLWHGSDCYCEPHTRLLLWHGSLMVVTDQAHGTGWAGLSRLLLFNNIVVVILSAELIVIVAW